MTDKVAFELIRKIVTDIKNGLLYHMGKEESLTTPVVITVISVEEDGHIWLHINSRSRKWIWEDNLPVRVQFISEKSVVDLNGIARSILVSDIPVHFLDDKDYTPRLLLMKVYYGEYVPFAGTNSFCLWGAIKKWFGDQSRHFPVFATRRLFIFR